MWLLVKEEEEEGFWEWEGLWGWLGFLLSMSHKIGINGQRVTVWVLEWRSCDAYWVCLLVLVKVTDTHSTLWCSKRQPSVTTYVWPMTLVTQHGCLDCQKLISIYFTTGILAQSQWESPGIILTSLRKVTNIKLSISKHGLVIKEGELYRCWEFSWITWPPPPPFPRTLLCWL